MVLLYFIEFYVHLLWLEIYFKANCTAGRQSRFNFLTYLQIFNISENVSRRCVNLFLHLLCILFHASVIHAIRGF
jgi:hypothetical protein